LEYGFHETLGKARDLGELKPGADPGSLARALTTTCYGIGLLARLPGSGPRIADGVTFLLGMLDEATS
jgi:hypothetical protein